MAQMLWKKEKKKITPNIKNRTGMKSSDVISEYFFQNH